ncbi:MAG: hypothetical protein ABIN36_16395 [Ferruginibacter sp.]
MAISRQLIESKYQGDHSQVLDLAGYRVKMASFGLLTFRLPKNLVHRGFGGLTYYLEVASGLHTVLYWFAVGHYYFRF